MVVLKAFLIFLLNVALTFPLVFAIRTLLFVPKERLYYFNRRVPLTPALLYRWKGWLIDKLRKMLYEFLRDCEDKELDSRVKRLEERVYKKIWEKMDVVNRARYLPKFIARYVQAIIAQIVYEFVSYFIRTFIPYLIEEYRIERYIDLLEIKLDVGIVEKYYDRYVHRFLCYFSLFIFIFIGFYNSVIYLLIR